jgi:hypothetical protein
LVLVSEGATVLTFKEYSDLVKWRANLGGDDQVRKWISMFHALSVIHTGQPAVVTSWYRDDGTAHKHGNAVDFRVRHYSSSQLRRLMRLAINAGIPVVLVRERTPSAHLHCGDLATLKYERGKPRS